MLIEIIEKMYENIASKKDIIEHSIISYHIFKNFTNFFLIKPLSSNIILVPCHNSLVLRPFQQTFQQTDLQLLFLLVH